ncbi:MAG TPA: UbiA-like polyprenyltransferase [Thermodesulfovibrionia bacterium]|nr:UbiA-like polyprenyltransferase [Thermodesulfovibrionia bacterium]
MSVTGLKKIADYLRMIKFSHSIFALPFAFTGAILAAKGIPEYSVIGWIIVAMVGARSGAMGLNRLIDCRIDAQNPRTAQRELPKGVLKHTEVILFTVIAFGVFLFAAYKLNPLCFKLSPLALAVFSLYSYTKRFTWLSHMVLGIALALAPLGAWIAVTGTFDAAILPLSLAVVCWVAGFDIFYAFQDLDFDKRYGLYSIPANFGIKTSMWVARFLHIITILLLLSLAPLFNMSILYLTGVLIAAAMLFYEHTLVKEHDLSKINMAFFNMNGYISITVFVFTLLSYL